MKILNTKKAQKFNPQEWRLIFSERRTRGISENKKGQQIKTLNLDNLQMKAYAQL